MLTAPGFGDSLAGLVRLYDTSWYATIAEHGYDAGPFDASVRSTTGRFFRCSRSPGAPRRAVTGEFALTGIALANLCFLVALLLVHRLALALDFAPPTADRAVLALALFPVSYFFALPWTESLFLLLSAACVSRGARERWWLAGVLAALASITRLNGLFLLAGLAIMLWQARDRVPPQRGSRLRWRRSRSRDSCAPLRRHRRCTRVRAHPEHVRAAGASDARGDRVGDPALGLDHRRLELPLAQRRGDARRRRAPRSGSRGSGSSRAPCSSRWDSLRRSARRP